MQVVYFLIVLPMRFDTIWSNFSGKSYSNTCQIASLLIHWSSDIASILVEGDLLGHDTHGLQLLKPYLDALGRQAMLGSGEIKEIASRPAVACWDGRYLPGPCY